MPPKGNDTPPPSPLRSQRLLEITPSPGDPEVASSSFAVDDGGGGGRRWPPLVSGPITVPDISAVEDGGDEGEGGDSDAADDSRQAERAAAAVPMSPSSPRRATTAAAAVEPSVPASIPAPAAAVVDDHDHPQHRDESLPCPTTFPRAAKARRTAGLAHPASPPPGDIFRRIREAADHDEDGVYVDDDSDEDGALEEVCLDMGLRMEMDSHRVEQPSRGNDEGEASTDEHEDNKAGRPKSRGAFKWPQSPPSLPSSSSLSIPKTPSPLLLRRRASDATPRRSSLKKPASVAFARRSSTMTDAGTGSASNNVVARRRRISFSSLEIRPYSVTLGDHPCCSSGPPLSLGWDYDEKAVVSVELDEYESSRGERRSRREMRMGVETRREILLSSGDGDSPQGEKAKGGGGASGMTERDLRRAERRVYREQTRTRSVHQVRKTTGFFFASPPPAEGGGVVIQTKLTQPRDSQE